MIKFTNFLNSLKINGILIVRFGTAETINLLLTAISGFLMIQHLSKDSYGVYGFLTTGTTLIISLSEMGISHCFLPLVGFKNITSERVNAVYTIFKSRRIKLLIISTTFVMPVIIFLMFKNHWINLTYTFSVLGMLVAGYYAINEQLYRQKFIALNQSKIIANSTLLNSLIKATWTIIALYCFNESVALILLSCNGLFASMAAISLYKNFKVSEDLTTELTQVNSIELNDALDKLYKPIRVPAFLYVLFASFGGLIIGYFANALTIADVNASGRLIMCLLIVNRISEAFIMPRLAQAPNIEKYIKMVLTVHFIYLVLASFLIFSVWLLPSPWLYLIGAKYSNLKDVLWIAFLGGILTNLYGFTFTCLSSRGFTSNQMPILICGIITQVLSIYVFGMRDAYHVFIVNAVTAGVFVVGYLILLFLKIREHKLNQILG